MAGLGGLPGGFGSWVGSFSEVACTFGRSVEKRAMLVPKPAC